MSGVVQAAESLGLQVKRQAPHPDKGSSMALIIRGLASWEDATPVVLFSRGRISWQLKAMRSHNPFRAMEKEQELRDRLAAFPTTELRKADWPDTLLTDVETEAGLQTFREVLGWTVERIRKVNR